MLLKDKITLVTGANRGIGLAISLKIAEQGGILILSGRSLEKIKRIESMVRDRFPDGQVISLEMDVSNLESVKEGFRKIFNTYKKLDVLVANAGILEDSLIGMVTQKQIENVFSTNTYGVLYCCQYASRLMAKNRNGSIILISSIIGRYGNSGQSVYAASKSAVIGIAKSLSKELAPSNIRVNVVAPGFIDTDMARSLSKDKFDERLSSIKLGRIGTGQDIANAVLFLASDLSSYVTGQILGVDGGMLI